VFAGVSLEGATLRPDHKDNREMYGREVTQREILTGATPRPAGADALYADLDRFPKRSASR
jgi:lipid-binding SYLF domain-containing protein